VGQKHKHLEVGHLLMLLQEAKGFRGEATVETPIGMHLHLQEDNRPLFAATRLMAGPEHAIGMVGHLFEGHRPEDVGGFPFGAGSRFEAEAGAGAGAGAGNGVRCWVRGGRHAGVASAGGQPGQKVTDQIGQGPGRA
jgi:hypothetical protein